MQRHDSMTAAEARAMVTEICLLANGRAVTSVLICDDRPTAARSLSEMLQPLPALVHARWVMDGFALVDAYAVEPVDLVLIGVHGENRLGTEAMGLMLGINPTAVIMIVGSVVDAEALASAFARGARSLLVWEADQAPLADGPLVW
jgi:PleD family two-component response regulator